MDTQEAKVTIQVLVLCPTRELAQAGEEIRKLSRFLPGIRLAEVYGGANMERQFIQPGGRTLWWAPLAGL